MVQELPPLVQGVVALAFVGAALWALAQEFRR
jgi:hypothetical protein